MTATSLFRLGAWSAVLGGVLMAIDVVAHLFVEDTLEPSALGGLPHEVWHIPGIVGIILVLLGLIAIYLRQADQIGKVGLAGFVLLVVGITLGATYSTVFHGLFVPAIEGLQSGLFAELVDSTTVAQFVRGVVVQALGLGIGAILFGIATIRGRVLPAIGGWLFIAAAVFAAANEAFSEAQLVARVLFAVAFIWLGFAVLSAPMAGHRTPPRTTGQTTGGAR
ncbi:MAG: hypothetical protein ACYSUM_13330 [Planctomycetota bacterium]|jgi:hypothetical protein